MRNYYACQFILWVYFFAKYNFLKGFDFTDSTLSFHFSLRVLNGDIPFKDFHSTALPLTYYVGAFCHFLFGKSLLVNNCLGLFCKFIQAFLIYLILYKFIQNKTNIYYYNFFGNNFWRNKWAIYFISHLPILFVTFVYLSLISLQN